MSVKRKRQSLLGVLCLAVVVCFIVPFIGDQTRYVNVYAQTHLGKVHLGKVSLNQEAAGGGSTHDTSTFGDFTEHTANAGVTNANCYGNEYIFTYHTAATGDSVTWVHVKMGAAASGGPHTLKIALYDVAADTLEDLIYTSGDITWADSEVEWDSVSVAWPLTNGVTYGLAVGNMSATGTFSFYYGGDADSVSQSTEGTFQSTWTGTGKLEGYGAFALGATYVSEL